MISNKPSAADKAKGHEQLFAKAHEAGMKAAEKVQVVPMHVVQRANPFDDNSPIVKSYAPVEGGVCGFAWVTVSPGNSSFALWLKKTHRGRNAYQGGVQIWVSDFGQSMTRKEAYASAFAAVLRETGLKAYAGSRMD
jgi:hypothetical protein